MTCIEHRERRFFFTNSCPTPVVQHLAVYPVQPHHSALLSDHNCSSCEVDLFRPFPALALRSFCVRFSACRLCPNSFNFLCSIESSILQCLSTFSLTILLPILSNNEQHGHNNSQATLLAAMTYIPMIRRGFISVHHHTVFTQSNISLIMKISCEARRGYFRHRNVYERKHHMLVSTEIH